MTQNSMTFTSIDNHTASHGKSISDNQENFGRIERAIRAIFAPAGIFAMLLFPGDITWQPYATYAGIYLAVTALTTWDPLYALLGLNSRHRANAEEPSDISDRMPTSLHYARQ
ncbi:MAG: DUF2892 domain-containing protein [Gammaproteobacteria bacterium]|nr:DUF2892 domain-containing protein [Gammaproteobacteria bacterium]